MKRLTFVCSLLSLALLSGAVTWAEAGEHAPPSKPPAKRLSFRQQTLANKARELLAPMETDKGLELLVTFPTGKGNAADHYAKLEILYTKEKQNRHEKDFTVDPEGQGVKEILAATKIRSCSLTPHYYPHMETGDSNQPDMIVYGAYIQALLHHASNLERKGDLKAANRAYQAGLIWGWHFTLDRPNLITFTLGLSAKVQSARAYAVFLRRHLKGKKAKHAEEYVEKLVQIQGRAFAKNHIYLGEHNKFSCLYSAILIAKEDKDPLWRQEALLNLGVLRHGAPHATTNVLIKDGESQRLAAQALTEVASKDPHPWIRNLAKWTIEHITPEKFTNMRRKQLKDMLGPKNEPAEEDTKQKIERVE